MNLSPVGGNWHRGSPRPSSHRRRAGTRLVGASRSMPGCTPCGSDRPPRQRQATRPQPRRLMQRSAAAGRKSDFPASFPGDRGRSGGNRYSQSRTHPAALVRSHTMPGHARRSRHGLRVPRTTAYCVRCRTPRHDGERTELQNRTAVGVNHGACAGRPRLRTSTSSRTATIRPARRNPPRLQWPQRLAAAPTGPAKLASHEPVSCRDQLACVAVAGSGIVGTSTRRQAKMPEIPIRGPP